MSASSRGLCSMATRGLPDELAARPAQCAGAPIGFLAVGGAEAARRIAEGESFDVVVLASDAIDKLAAAGRTDAPGKVDLFGSNLAAAVRAGAALMALFAQWGLGDRLRDRLVPPARRCGRFVGRARRGGARFCSAAS